MPILNPATLQDYLDLGLYGFALSRFSGCWVGFKAISETVESSASIYSDPSRVQVVLPTDFEMPPGGLNIRWPDPPLEQERRLHGAKMAAVAAFARANQLDRIVLDSKPARFGIVARQGLSGFAAGAGGSRHYREGCAGVGIAHL
jgi:indolepyruvate ferredoxin oxidoreductase